MDVDLLSGFINGHDTGASPDMLSNLQGRGRLKLTADHIAENRGLDGGIIDAGNPDHRQKRAVITKIEDIFESIVDSILDEEKQLVILLKSRVKTKIANTDGSTQLNSSSNSETKNISFPSKSPQEAWKFSE
jgi:meiotic recombination protein SPO11